MCNVTSNGLCASHQAMLLRKGVLKPLKKDFWSNEDVAVLKQWYESHPGKLDLEQLAKILGKDARSVSGKASSLGLTNIRRRWAGSRRKCKSPEEVKQRISESTKRHIKENGHPKGMKGKKHTDAVKAVISEKSKAFHDSLSVADYRKMVDKGIITKLARYGSAGPNKHQTNPYSRTVGGKRDDLGGCYFRSAWEANYARYLNWLVANRKITSWKFEAKTFMFPGVIRGCISYTPDFEVVESDGRIVYHEIKGWMDKKSKTRLRRMKQHFPEVTVILIEEKQYKAIASIVSSLIPGWEGKVETWRLRRRS